MPAEPSTPKGQATRRRILDAASDEFASRGIAGARIDRITEAARTNKAQLYGYFGSKDRLFDAVIADSVDHIASAAAFDDDLAGWAVRLYDDYLVRPELVRLTTWLRMERRPAGPLFDSPRHDTKLAAIARAQAEGRIRQADPSDLLALVIALSCTWSPASSTYAATAEDPAAEHERRRTLLRESVQRILAP